MATESAGVDLVSVVTLLGAAVVAVPVFKRIGLGSVLGYLAAGLAIGPFGLGVFSDPMAILHVAELGVVMFLFIIGLEMEPSKLWAMRRDIFGLGLAQVLVCVAVLSLVGFALGYPYAGSLIAGAGFTLTSTAIVMQMLQERGDIAAPKGQRIVSVLLLEDLAIVPLLALVAFLAPGGEEVTLADRLLGVGIGLGAIAALVVAGIYLLNPMFRLLAASRAREVMTAAALLVVLGSALWLQLGGLSAAMGAFLAGVLLSESTFRHQLEADVEPFRGILLGLFFLAVGMALDLSVIADNWGLVAVSVAAFMVLKSAVIYGVARLMGAPHPEALERMVLMAQGGEFAFVLYSAALAVGLLSLDENAILNAIIIVSMALTPVMVMLHDRFKPAAVVSLDGMEAPDGQTASVLIIGFGRFGQIASQPLLARKCPITIIDDDPEMIRAAETFGFKVWFGDGTRLDILQAAGAGSARAVVIATDRREVTTRIAKLVRDAFPNAAILARAFDREHALELIREGVDHQMREVFHSALALGSEVLEVLGVDPDEIAEIAEGVRRRDAERLALQMTGDIYSGTSLLLGNAEHTARPAS
ncbi:monovalent cation:proton antiporter-2 (CPA2) family protein [Rhodobacter calidifons]|uniref:Potassium transporter n=1 Tax=Rhodobacter calidifons TaxID=2715277 RepID=A0ABX0G8I3_9RHOB|nr:monovalent cation:proton antiporter-2 (CPA2) family protein [Rhodobacter calidifons]NHB77531.1 potassium transporter [Rhodobacter calidifons]